MLFFVSVGMLFDPAVLIERTGALAATVLIIVIGKSAVALAIVRAFGHPLQTGFAVAAGLAQIGEFSFMLAALGVRLDLLPEEGRDLILAGAILSILANPLIFRLLASRHAIVKAAVPTGASPPATATRRVAAMLSSWATGGSENWLPTAWAPATGHW